VDTTSVVEATRVGDPFHAAKLGEAESCSCFAGWCTLTLVGDDGEEYDAAVPCRTCGVRVS
jgi:hypothetical protein